MHPNRNVLRSASVGLLHWNPPTELKAVAGSRRGSIDGFWVGAFGGTSDSHAPSVENRPVTIAEALHIASRQDRLLSFKSQRLGDAGTSEAWVRAIVRELPEALTEALKTATQRVTSLQELAAVTGHMLAIERDDDDPNPDDVPF